MRQLPGFDYTDPRVEVLVDVKDDRSKFKLTLDIGTELGLSDVMAGYEMGGPQIVITEVRTNWYRNEHSCSFFTSIHLPSL